MPSYLAAPEGGARGAVVVIQEAFGVTSHIEDVCRRFADSGWWALAPALFHRQGSPVLAYDDFSAVMPIMRRLTAEGIAADLDGAFAYAEGCGYNSAQTAIVGFCMGGTVALFAGTARPLGAAVSFYGGGVVEGRFGMASLVELAPGLRSPWLGLYGDLDKGIPVEQVEALRAAAAEASVPTEVLRYPDADHGFHCDDRPAVYNAAAAKDAWERTLAWLEDHAAEP
ncbi:MAG: dienelactone hydrolase family protein [Acidimicrobiales bacterium]